MNDYPGAGAGINDLLRKKIDAAVAVRNLARASNNTRWDQLIDHFRGQTQWRPSYRSKSVTGHTSDWDAEWFYHLPFPFAVVEWFDIGLLEEGAAKGMLLQSTTVDHTDEISRVVAEIGFDFEVRADVLRIWGYLPRSYEDFPPL